jgi:hypothetical protein
MEKREKKREVKFGEQICDQKILTSILNFRK